MNVQWQCCEAFCHAVYIHFDTVLCDKTHQSLHTTCRHVPFRVDIFLIWFHRLLPLKHSKERLGMQAKSQRVHSPERMARKRRFEDGYDEVRAMICQCF